MARKNGGKRTSKRPAPSHEKRPDALQREATGAKPAEPSVEPDPTRSERHRIPSNALGTLIERQFADPSSPCHSYSDLERRSKISREALSRYVTARPDRRRSPNIDTLMAIADALHLGLEATCRAAAASAKSIALPPQDQWQVRGELLASLAAGLSDEQFSAVVELLRQMRPLGGNNAH